MARWRKAGVGRYWMRGGGTLYTVWRHGGGDKPVHVYRGDMGPRDLAGELCGLHRTIGEAKAWVEAQVRAA